jgi:hypothetical protein
VTLQGAECGIDRSLETLKQGLKDLAEETSKYKKD